MAIDGPHDGGAQEPDDGVDVTCAIDFASLSGEEMSELLSRIPGAVEGVELAWQEVLAGDFVPISEL